MNAALGGTALATAAFLTIELPGRRTALGRLSRQVPGLEIDMVGRMEPTTPPEMLLDFIARPISRLQMEEAKQRLVPAYREFTSVDTGGGRWHVRGRVGLEEIRAPGLRLVASLHGLTRAPCLTIRDGRVTAIMRPMHDGSIDTLAHLVKARMAQMRVRAQVRVEQLDPKAYEHRCARLADALPLLH